MIKLETLAAQLQSDLNVAAIDSELQEVLPNTSFVFRVVLDSADYKRPEKSENTVTYYINALMKIISSEAEGTNAESYTGTVGVSVEYLVPVIGATDEDGQSIVLSYVRDIISSIAQFSSKNVTEDGIIYYEGLQYRIATTGSRAVREGVGDSVTLITFGTYFFVAQGISSSEYELYIVTGAEGEEVEERINYLSLGISRKTSSESNLSSADVESGSSAAKSTPQNTVLVFALASPARLGTFGEKLANYLATGAIEVLKIKLKIPNASEPYLYKMIFDSAGASAETNLAASISATLVEYQEV